jgi:hypothetical protein
MSPYMQRRDFITLLGDAAAAWPFATHAQQTAGKIPRIGIIENAPLWDNFRRGLRDQGCEIASNCGSDAVSMIFASGYVAPINLAWRRSIFALPYICRFTSLSLVI